MVVKLPTLAVPARLALRGSSSALAAELFVADVPRAARSILLDDVADLLDDRADFVPARVDERVRLYSKHAIAWLAVPRRDEIEFDDSPSEVIVLYDRQHKVKIELASGAALTGVLFDSSPSDRPRVVDHLNNAGRFVRLWTSDEHILVNKVEIVGVSEVE